MADSQTPAELKYSSTDEWARIEGNQATIGITYYAQDQLGDVVAVELPWNRVGALQLRADEEFGEVESVKSVSTLQSPLSGKLVRVNEALRDSAELVNSDPYGQGWMIVIELSDPAEADKLMSAERYAQYRQDGGH
jgi:glycine cleavage system H protein